MKVLLRDFNGFIATKNFNDIHPFELKYSDWKKIFHEPVSDTVHFSTQVRQHPTQAHHIIIAKGSARDILHRCSKIVTHENNVVSLFSPNRYSLLKQLTDAELRGYSVDAIGYKYTYASRTTDKDMYDLIFAGFSPNTFSIHSDCFEILHDLQRSNIEYKIASTESPGVCIAIGKEVGMNVSDDTVLTSSEIQQMSDRELLQYIGRTNIFSHIVPLDLLRLIRLTNAVSSYNGIDR